MVSFPTTRWSMVFQAADANARSDALSELCSAYWFPVYAFIRGKTGDPEQAKDLAQSFFLRLLEKHDFAPGIAEGVRFRSFLLASVKHFLSNQRDHARTQRRGGAMIAVSFDADEGAKWEPADTLTPEKIFEKEWAAAVVDQTTRALRLECEAAGRGAQFAVLKECLAGDASATYDEIGNALGMTGGAVKVAVYRLRRRFRELLRDGIANTVADPAEVEDELRYLLAVTCS